MGVIFFLLGALISSAFIWKSQQPVLAHVASAARMPIPGKEDVQLAARTYGLYFGMRNPPTRRRMSVPNLKFKFVPPDGGARSEYQDLQGELESRVDGFETIQIARLVVHAPGKHHVEVTSEESVGSFSIGELPALPSEDDRMKSILIGVVVGAISLVISAALVIRGIMRRRDARPGS